MDLPLGELSLATFAPLVEGDFDLQLEGASLPLRLVEARGLGSARPGGRAPFSLLFRAASAAPLPQGLRRLAHPSLGALEIFLVPVGRDADSVLYEAVFS